MRIELLNPKNDYVFKRIFGHIGNENITKQMISTILKRTINKIKLDESTILEKDMLDDKIGIIDVHAKLEETIEVDIELQVINQKDIEKRLMFYWSKLYTKGINSGEDYNKLNRTIVILIADFELKTLNKIPEFYTKWQIRESKYTSVILTDVLEIYIIELPKAIKRKEITEKELKPWVDFLENPKDMELINMSKQNAVAIKEAKKILKEISEDEHERYLAELREKYIRDQKAIEAFGYDNGLKIGVSRGRNEGKIEGKIEGRVEAKKEIAKRMLKRNFSIEVILAVTGLTIEEIEKLK